MTPAQVRARIAKRTKHCNRDQADRPCVARYLTCPGWRLFITPRNNVRLIACEECNALAPKRLQVTNEMVRSLYEAKEAQRRRNEELRREKLARNTTTHLRVDPGSMDVLCGAEIGRTPRGRRRHGWTYFLADVTCEKCRRLGAMTPAEREAERAAKLEPWARKRAELKSKQDQARAARRAEIAERVEATRPDAMVMLDAIEAAGGATSVDLLSWSREEHEMLARCLEVAVDAQVLAGGVAGKRRLWISGTSIRGICDVHCRFCREVLDHDRALGHVGEHEFMDHTVPCALLYLLPADDPRRGPRAEVGVSPDDDTVSGSRQDEDDEAT